MAFNRIADRDFDALNARTATRAIPAGILTVGFVWSFTVFSAALFFVAAAMLNRLTLILAPVALASVLLYSFSKRWTLLSHLVLGWCLSIAPTGAWIAVRGTLDSPIPLLLSLVVMLWTAGFDVLYACQDYDFDVTAHLHSIPRYFGIQRSLWIARLLHAGAFVALVALYWITALGLIALVGVVATGILLVYQHRLVRADDLSRLNAAFFTTNAFVSVILFITFGGATLMRKWS
jgi:4-hydroxybenzoate polyprenyltransferase